jgi:hypothetical protein
MSVNIITTIKNINLDQDCCARCKGKFENEESKKIVPFADDNNFYCRRCVQFVFEEWQEKYKDEEEEEDGMEDCDDCGYTHHCEDKCPIGEQCEKFENWREREEGDCVDDRDVTCDVCKTETIMDATVGCCVNEHLCRTNNMCAECGKYDEDTDEWTCNKCLKPTIVYTGVRRKRILPPIKIV